MGEEEPSEKASSHGQDIQFIQDGNEQNYVPPESEEDSAPQESEGNDIKFIDDGDKQYEMDSESEPAAQPEPQAQVQAEEDSDLDGQDFQNLQGASALASSKQDENSETPASEVKDSTSEQADYEKKFTGKIMGLDSDEDGEPDDPKSSEPQEYQQQEELEEDNPPPEDSDGKYSDEYFDQDEDYLEHENKEEQDNGNFTLYVQKSRRGRI